VGLFDSRGIIAGLCFEVLPGKQLAVSWYSAAFVVFLLVKRPCAR